MSIMEVTVIGLQRANGSDINLHSPERSRPYTEVCKSLIFFLWTHTRTRANPL